MYSEREIRKIMQDCVLPEFAKYVKSKHRICNHHELQGAFYTSFRRYFPTIVKDKHSIYGSFSQSNMAVLHINDEGIIEQLEFEVIGRGGYNGLTDAGVELLNDCTSKFNFVKESISLSFDRIITDVKIFNIRPVTTF